jgi:hypothetical protein
MEFIHWYLHEILPLCCATCAFATHVRGATAVHGLIGIHRPRKVNRMATRRVVSQPPCVLTIETCPYICTLQLTLPSIPPCRCSSIVVTLPYTSSTTTAIPPSARVLDVEGIRLRPRKPKLAFFRSCPSCAGANWRRALAPPISSSRDRPWVGRGIHQTGTLHGSY